MSSITRVTPRIAVAPRITVVSKAVAPKPVAAPAAKAPVKPQGFKLPDSLPLMPDAINEIYREMVRLSYGPVTGSPDQVAKTRLARGAVGCFLSGVGCALLFNGPIWMRLGAAPFLAAGIPLIKNIPDWISGVFKEIGDALNGRR